jgi:hypothetical protein
MISRRGIAPEHDLEGEVVPAGRYPALEAR